MRYAIFILLLLSVESLADEIPAPTQADRNLAVDLGAALRGYQFLTEKAYLPPDFDQSAFDAIWRTWPKALRHKADQASIQKRREMAFDRYGLTQRPGAVKGTPLQYVVDQKGHWTMNCFSCHGGSVYGKPYPGAPNNRFALQTLSEEMRAVKFRLGKGWTRMELGSTVIPLGTTRGTTNAVAFGVALMNYRDPQLNLVRNPLPKIVHHDMDAPPWWYFYRRPNIYIDGFAARGHRGLMQFMLIRENGPEKFREWENDFRDVWAYLMSLRPPKYIGPMDHKLASRGEPLFLEHCAECHGTYGRHASYPNRRISIEEIRTDPVRLSALSVEGRAKYGASWFAHAREPNRQKTVSDPGGYLAPPLDGIWASPPYLHNGSVPTLWHLLKLDKRPVLWRRTSEAIDPQRIGFQIEIVDRVPLIQTDVAVRREYFDTRRFGKSAAGHDFPDVLQREEKRAVLEYLKTL